MLPSSWASLAWWRRMLCTFQHPPGAEARSFIASAEDCVMPLGGGQHFQYSLYHMKWIRWSATTALGTGGAAIAIGNQTYIIPIAIRLIRPIRRCGRYY